jgi:nitroreductase
METKTGEGDAGIVFRTIGERRSIREYEEREVPEEVIRRLIDIGVQAPTGLGIQPWKFVVVRDKALMREVSDYCKAALIEDSEGTTDENIQRFVSLLSQKEFNIFYNAPVLIAILGAVEDDMSAVDCTLCAENMMLAAWSIGIGSCWIGSASIVNEDPDLMERLAVPEEYDLVAPLIFGYPAKVPEKPERREPDITWIG